MFFYFRRIRSPSIASELLTTRYNIFAFPTSQNHHLISSPSQAHKTYNQSLERENQGKLGGKRSKKGGKERGNEIIGDGGPLFRIRAGRGCRRLWLFCGVWLAYLLHKATFFSSFWIRYGNVSVPPQVVSVSKLLNIGRILVSFVEFSFVPRVSPSCIHSMSISIHTHLIRFHSSFANRSWPYIRRLPYLAEESRMPYPKVKRKSRIQPQNTNRIPGPLTLRMMLREVSSMNSTRTWVTPPREPKHDHR